MKTRSSTIIGMAFVSLALLIGATGCSPSKYAMGSVMVPVLDNAREAAMASNDLRTFRDAAPSSLFLVEGFIRTDPEREELRLNAAMLYFAYGFAFIEEDDPGYASLLYYKGYQHGKYALLQRNKKLLRDWDVPFDDFVAGLGELREKDVPAAVWTAANWAQFISIHLDSTAVLRDIPKVTSLLERAAELDGSYFEGLVHIMIGSLHSFRPPMMGGSPEKSLANFQKAFAIGGDSFLLARLFYARYYLYRIQDADAFQETLDGVLAAPIAPNDEFQLLNLVAKRKANILLGEIDDLF